jgi:hypothetical protein
MFGVLGVYNFDKGLPYIFVVTVRAVFSDAQNFYFLKIHLNSFEISN